MLLFGNFQGHNTSLFIASVSCILSVSPMSLPSNSYDDWGLGVNHTKQTLITKVIAMNLWHGFQILMAFVFVLSFFHNRNSGAWISIMNNPSEGKEMGWGVYKGHHASDTQSSHLRFGILENSLMSFEIIVRSKLRAWAAIIVSSGPIVFPLDSRNALIFP